MEKEFVPYELALRLKALGFNEKCYGYFTKDKEFFYFDVDDLSSAYTKNMDNLVVNSVNGLECTAPLYQQAFRWFRDKYNLNPLVVFDKFCEIDDEELENPYFTYYYSINELWAEGKDYDKFTRGFINVASNRDMLSHEEAELECLGKLIEIVESKKE